MTHVNAASDEKRKKVNKVGIIGCGGIAQVHAWALGEMQNVELRAFCDVELGKAVALADKTRGCGRAENGEGALECVATDDWTTFLDLDLDVVHVCTPHHLHAPMAMELLRNGKAVFMEKPCAISLEQFLALKAEEERHPGKLGFCFQNRYNETTLLMDKLIRDGRIGKILGGRAFVTWRRDEDYYAGSPWKGRLETEGGGALINQSIHTLDLLLRYLGNPSAIRGMIANHHLQEEIEVEDAVEAWMKFPDGKRACFYASNAYVTDAPVYLELQGDEGRICMNGSEVTVYANQEAPWHHVCERTKGIGKGYWGCGHKACIEDYYRSLTSGETWQNSLSGVENTFLAVMEIYQETRKIKR